MSTFLIDTLVWTGALLALVLLIRRPVAALFGPRAAYALWALPMVRLLLPPLVLPAWLAPTLPATEVFVDGAVEAPLAAPRLLEFTASAAEPPIDWTALLLALWLVGAGAFLARRYALYFAMRRELLEAARPVGEAGRVRLVETAAAPGPVAFGVIDKVVALPPGFMAAPDRAARDLALAHELEHHRGRDLVCNMLVQPLFALHWFNPLSLLGWRAFRRDQEAACDARVIANAPRETRAAYAAVIARFALQPCHAARLALAAPMACPVLGDRSIVHRLRSLAMSDISSRRRWAGRALLAAATLALPLTGSISYARSDRLPPVTSVPPAPMSAPTPPAAAAAPQAPAAPDAPHVMVGKDGKHRIVRIERIVTDDAPAGTAMIDGKRRVERRIFLRNGQEMTAEERAVFERDMKNLQVELGDIGDLRQELKRELGDHGELGKELRRDLGENGELRREIRSAVADAAQARAHARAAVAAAPQVTVRCRTGQQEVAEIVESRDGRRHIFVCNSLATAEATRAIAIARAEIASTRELSEMQRADALRSLDEAERKTRAD